MGFDRQEYWSGWPFPSPGALPHPGIQPTSPEYPALHADSLPLGQWGSTKGPTNAKVALVWSRNLIGFLFAQILLHLWTLSNLVFMLVSRKLILVNV